MCHDPHLSFVVCSSTKPSNWLSVGVIRAITCKTLQRSGKDRPGSSERPSILRPDTGWLSSRWTYANNSVESYSSMRYAQYYSLMISMTDLLNRWLRLGRYLHHDSGVWTRDIAKENFREFGLQGGVDFECNFVHF